MTYEQAMTVSDDDPFTECYAWLRIPGMEGDEYRVVMIVKPRNMRTTVLRFDVDNCEDEMRRAAVPGDLAWDSHTLLVSPQDKQRTDWHKGTLQQLIEWVRRLF